MSLTWNQRGLTAVMLLLAYCTFVRASKENVLHGELFKTYNKHVRPVHQRNTTVGVVIQMLSSGFIIDDVNLLKGTVSGNVWLEVSWTDQFLSWNSSDYDDVGTISVDSKDIWLPDIVLSGQKGQVYFFKPESIDRALVWSDGIVKIWAVLYMDIGFDVSVYRYPFDIHDCFIQIISWSNTNNLVSIKFSEETEAFLKEAPPQANGQWEIVNIRVENTTLSKGTYVADQAYYYFTLKRKWLYYVLNIMAPVAATSALNILCFALPSDSGERITLCISIYLTLAVFLNVVNNALPETSDEQSILSIYIGLQYLASTFTIIMTVITLKLYHKEDTYSCSGWFVEILDKVRKRKRKYTTESSDGDNCVRNKPPTATAKHSSWKSFSNSLNTVCFYLLVAWNIGLIIAFIVVVKSK